MRQENNARFARVEAKIEGNALQAMQTRVDTRIDTLENSNSSSQTESTTKEEVRELAQGVIKEHAVEESLEDTHCQTKPITHAFIQFKTEDRNGFLRLSGRQRYTIEQRTIPRVCEIQPQNLMQPSSSTHTREQIDAKMDQWTTEN